MRLGTHNSKDTSSPTGKPIFPVAFNAYSKFFLYEGRPNIKYDFWTEKQRERAEELGHKKIIENINILPHGGGYALNLPYTDVDYTILNGEIYYKLFNPLMEGSFRTNSARYLEYEYRNPDYVLPMVDRFELGEKMATFVPEEILKL
jgi:hypothetical protein